MLKRNLITTISSLLLSIIISPLYSNLNDNSINNLFGEYFQSTNFDAADVGDIRDVALHEEFAYVLVRDFNLISDAIFKINRDSGKVVEIWGIGKFKSAAIESDGKFLWVLGEKKDYFLRVFSFSGKWVKTCKIKSELNGSPYGLGIIGDKFYFSLYDGKRSEVCVYDSTKETHRAIYTFSEKIESLCVSSNRLYMYQNYFDTYASHWLLIVDFNPQRYKIMRFINNKAIGMANDGKNIYYMTENSQKLSIHPFTVIDDEKIVLAKPLRRKVRISYCIKSDSVPSKVTLWIPNPINTKNQSVKDISFEPKPIDSITDIYGNRWSFYHFEKLDSEQKLEMKFELTNSDIAYTMDKYIPYNKVGIPPAILDEYSKATSVFDLGNLEEKNTALNLPWDYFFISRLLRIRDYIFQYLTVRSIDNCITASCYLNLGNGMDRGHSVGFATLSRSSGIPTKVIGGVVLPLKNSISKYTGYYWNHVYFPGSGWVDIDMFSDHKNNESNSFDYVGYQSNRYCILFAGALETPDYKNIFSDRNFSHVMISESLKGSLPSKAIMGEIMVQSEDIVQPKKVEEKKHMKKNVRKRRRARK